ncbi:LOW QUALITY PROTEIN: odorant receptor 22c-like [Anopheles nili]|uniref:LOW QUALITY PROTEIN: odorant receptor 22c-like n=1 Tax=Anopheles nili TaxID=185578 RepID=UPI00237B71BA|nr:LOW QUALITY PROTEIN: odorant receptor 22c-like [Anopheles nili]
MKALMVFNVVSLALCITGEFLHGLYAYQDGDLSETIESICPTVARISGFLRIVFYIIYRSEIEDILLKIHQVIRNEHPRENDTTKRMKRLGQKFTLFLMLSMFFAALLYGVTPFFIMTYNWFQGQRPLVKLLPFKIALPFDSQKPLIFFLVTVFLNYASSPTINSQTGCDSLFSGVCLYLSGQFVAIRLEIEALAASVDRTALKASSSETHRINEELKRISARHQQLIDLVNDARQAFVSSILLVYTCSALIICIVCIAMLVVRSYTLFVRIEGPSQLTHPYPGRFSNPQVQGIYKLTYIPYALAELILLFLYSYSGTIIRDSSEAIQTVAYGFPWYQFDRNTRHLIQMIMIRAQYGSNLNVPFFEPSMESFSVIVRTASSYITLMNSFL